MIHRILCNDMLEHPAGGSPDRPGKAGAAAAAAAALKEECLYIYIYIYIMCVCIYIYIYIYACIFRGLQSTVGVAIIVNK